jgi:hypothetical protein
MGSEAGEKCGKTKIVGPLVGKATLNLWAQRLQVGLPIGLN